MDQAAKILNTGSTMPGIGFGTWQLHFNGRTKRIVLEALRVGYRLLDTAAIYGTERGVGAAVRESGLPREDIFVTTKLWGIDQPYERALKALDQSLRKLGLEYVDLYLVHWPVKPTLHESWRAMQDLHQSGKVKNIGVSNYSMENLEELAGLSNVLPAVNQIPFHPYIYKQQAPLVDYCLARGIAIEAYSPLNQGRGLHEADITAIAHKMGRTNAQVVLRWAMQHETIPIPKSGNSERLRENFKVFDFKLDEHDMQTLDNIG